MIFFILERFNSISDVLEVNKRIKKGEPLTLQKVHNLKHSRVCVR